MSNQGNQFPLKVTAIVLAAGLSVRMGQPKMVLPWGKQTVIETVVDTLKEGGVQEIVIVTGGSKELIEGVLKDAQVETVYNPNFMNGEMLDSIKVGLHALQGKTEAAIVALGDQPQMRATTVRSELDIWEKEKPNLIVPSYFNRRGHPWLVKCVLWDEILQLTPPHTLRNFLDNHDTEIRYLNIDTATILQDLDTPEDYARTKPASE